jgi:hypothetical protein
MRGATTFGIGVVGGALLIATAAGYAVRKYPDAVSLSGGAQLALFSFVLLVYLALGWWARSTRDVQVEASLRIGAAVGMFLGVVGAVNITVENFVTLPGALSAIVPASSMAIMIIAFALAASLSLRRSGSNALALLASVWSSVVAMVLTCAYGFLLNLAAIESLSRAFVVDAARAGVRDARVIVVENTLSSASMHMLVGPIVAASVGSVAILATLISRSLGRRAMFMLALIELGLFILGVVALVFAASLERAQRPPYVMTGMLVAALALACFPALALSRRRAA